MKKHVEVFLKAERARHTRAAAFYLVEFLEQRRDSTLGIYQASNMIAATREALKKNMSQSMTIQRINDNRELRTAWRSLSMDERRAALKQIGETRDDREILATLRKVKRSH